MRDLAQGAAQKIPGGMADSADSILIYPLQRDFYPQNLACTPKNDEVPYMLLYIEGTKIKNKTKCTPDFKMQWEPWQTLFRTGSALL